MSKELKEGSWESRGAQKARREHGLRNLAAKVSRCENRPPHGKMVSQPPSTLCKNFRSCEEVHWHTSPISQARTLVSQLWNGCETSTPWNPPFRSRDAIPKGVSQLRNHPLAHECHFAAVKWLRNLHALKSFSTHTMNRDVAAAPPIGHILKYFLKFISCIPYLVSNIRKSEVQCFKRYAIWSWNEEVMAVWRRPRTPWAEML